MRGTILLFALAAGVWPATAQSEGEQRLIKLNVAAIDAKGEPVTDLTAADIQLKEDGKARTLAFFRFSGSKRPMDPPAPGEVATRPAPPTTVLLLDRWNERIISTATAWTELTQAIRSLETTDGVYVYMLTNKGEMLPIRGLPEPGMHPPATLTAAELSGLLDDAVKKNQGFRSVDQIDPILAANTTFRAFNQLGVLMTSVSGRKNLVWVTHGLPLTVRIPGGDYKDFTPQIRAIAAASVLSEISIYTVDQSAAGAGAAPGGVSRETLEMFASLTGGRWYPSDNIDRAIAGAMADSRGNYTIAFRTAASEKDKKFHKIRLESTRKTVRLQTRDGFFSNTPDPQTEAFEEAAVAGARSSPFDASEIEVRVALTADAVAKTAHFRIRINASDVLLEPVNQHHVGHLSVVLASYAGGALNGSSRPIAMDVNLDEEQFQKALRDGLVVGQDLRTSDKTQTVRVIVFDRELRSIGSATVPLTAP